MKVSLHLRNLPSKSNYRAEAVAAGLKAAGCTIERRHRCEVPVEGADLILQTGFQASAALRYAIAEGLPYIIAEGPAFRHLPGIDVDTWISWGYGGLMGGAWHPPRDGQELWVPRLGAQRTSGRQIIFCQKPNDHSIRGTVTSHIAWLEKQLDDYPNAEVRPHPLMWEGELEPITTVMDECHHAITYTSTAGVEALIEGAVSHPDHWGSPAYNVTDRREWLQDLVWQNFSNENMRRAFAGKYILSGFEEARERARQGKQEHPRDKNLDMTWQYSPKIVERIEAC